MALQKGCLIIAGVGGVIPTISRLASTYVSDPSAPMPGPGLYFGLLLFFIIGAVLAFAFSETNIRQAFILGICAPGIITNIVAGVNDANSPSKTAFTNLSLSMSSAYAQDATLTVSPTTPNASITGFSETNLPKKIIINTITSGASSWDMMNIPISVAAIGKEGTKTNIAEFPAYQKSFEINVPDGTAAVQIRAAGFTNQVNLPNEKFVTATINSRLHVEGKHDFLWALGAKRSPRIITVDSFIGNVVTTKQSVAVKELIGQEVKKQDGTPVGEIEGIKIGPKGTIEKLFIKEVQDQIEKGKGAGGSY